MLIRYSDSCDAITNFVSLTVIPKSCTVSKPSAIFMCEEGNKWRVMNYRWLPVPSGHIRDLFDFLIRSCMNHVLPYMVLAGDTDSNGRDPFNQNFRKFRSKTEWIGSVQPEKFRKNWSTFWGGPLFPVGPVWILVQWIAPKGKVFSASLRVSSRYLSFGILPLSSTISWVELEKKKKISTSWANFDDTSKFCGEKYIGSSRLNIYRFSFASHLRMAHELSLKVYKVKACLLRLQCRVSSKI